MWERLGLSSNENNIGGKHYMAWESPESETKIPEENKPLDTIL
jgi:hypothetical protein